MKDELEQLISSDIAHIRAKYRQSLAEGVKRPVVWVIDTRDPVGRKILEAITIPGAETVKHAIEKSAIAHLGVSFEDTIQALPFGRKDLEAVMVVPRTMPVLVVAAGISLCVAVPEMDDV